MASADIAEQIANDKIDVLINLNGARCVALSVRCDKTGPGSARAGFTKFNRNDVFARRPAPISVNYFGFPVASTSCFFLSLIGGRGR